MVIFLQKKSYTEVQQFKVKIKPYVMLFKYIMACTKI